jgi:hypothetical protein
MDINTLLYTPSVRPVRPASIPGGTLIRATRRLPLLLALALVSLLALSCVTPQVEIDTPKGFAAYIDAEPYRAISAEGVRLRARLIENDPEQSLEFWREALRVKMERAGYAKLAEERFDAPSGEGAYFEWAAPVNGEDWVYMTAISLEEGQIVLVEAAGPFELYSAHRSAVKESLASLQVTERLR